MKLAIVGASGAVGQEFMNILEESRLPIDELLLFGSERSAGRKYPFRGKELTVRLLAHNDDFCGVDIALVSAGGSTSKEFAETITKHGTLMIDNSSAFRMDEDVPLVVPEVNPEDVDWNKGIIANPNCSTIQAVVALKPLHDKYKIKRIVYSTYQAVSGAGVAGYNDLKNGIEGQAPQKFPKPIAFNMLPHIDVFMEDGYTKEEWKMIVETKKILHDDSLKITATTVRVPVYYGHSESINIEFEKPCTREGVIETLKGANGIIVMDDVKNGVYPTPLDAENHDEVYVGRVRKDDSVESGVNIWCVADNIRKGAATNAVQIVEVLIKKKSEG